MNELNEIELAMVGGGMTENQCIGMWSLGGGLIGGIVGGWGGFGIGLGAGAAVGMVVCVKMI